MPRFKSSKYKNCFAKPAKKEDSITDLKVETPLCYGNHVSASAKFVATNIGTTDSGKVSVFKCSASGRLANHPTLTSHGGAVTDLQFSPFYHNRLATASEDKTVRVWNIPDDGLSENGIEAVSTLKGFISRPEVLQHHSVAENVLAISCGSELQVWNLSKEKSISNISCGSVAQSLSWSEDGMSLACTTKDKKLMVCDPRSNKIVSDNDCHANHKDSRVLYLGDSGKIATTGYSRTRVRELKAWDVRNTKSCLQTTDFGSSTGILMPFYDRDTKLLFVAGKADSSLTIMEVGDGTEYITQASQASLTDQTKGMGLLPKLAIDVMTCEVDRLYQLCARQIIPIKIEVPRRSHTDFASDLFPDTFSDDIVLTAEQWFEGSNSARTFTSLDPSKRKSFSVQSNSSAPSANQKSNDSEVIKVSENIRTEPKPVEKLSSTVSTEVTTSVKPKPFIGARQSKFRHWTGTVLHPSTHITNLSPVTRNISSACDTFHVNERFVALPLTTPGGPLAIVDLKKVGRITSSLSCLQNKASVTDFKWNPFESNEIAVGLDNGAVKIWSIPESGLKDDDLTPSNELEGHYSKVLCIAYHPLACDVLATASMDMNVIIWNLESSNMEIQLSQHEDEILHMAWSGDGKYLATVSKNSKILIFEPRESTYPIASGPGPQGSRGARVVFVMDDQMLLVSGFTKSGIRCVSLYRTDDIERGPLQTMEHDNSPSTLMPWYDPDTHVVLLTGKGDSTMISFEILSEAPYLAVLANFSSDRPHQGFSFLSKTKCDVKKVEFARAWRLSKNSIEPVSFKIPRVKMEYFQDDIFPDTRDLSRPIMNAGQWFSGKNLHPGKISLKPVDMKRLSDAPKEAPKQRKYESYNPNTYKTDEEKKDELVAAMSGKLDLDKQLEQDTMEGVDEDEWDD